MNDNNNANEFEVCRQEIEPVSQVVVMKSEVSGKCISQLVHTIDLTATIFKRLTQQHNESETSAKSVHDVTQDEW